MVTYNPVAYVDVGFCSILDEIQNFWGDGLVDVESIITIVEENDTEFWSKECLDILKEIKQSAEDEKFTGDVLFYN